MGTIAMNPRNRERMKLKLVMLKQSKTIHESMKWRKEILRDPNITFLIWKKSRVSLLVRVQVTLMKLPIMVLTESRLNSSVMQQVVLRNITSLNQTRNTKLKRPKTLEKESPTRDPKVMRICFMMGRQVWMVWQSYLAQKLQQCCLMISGTSLRTVSSLNFSRHWFRVISNLRLGFSSAISALISWVTLSAPTNSLIFWKCVEQFRKSFLIKSSLIPSLIFITSLQIRNTEKQIVRTIRAITRKIKRTLRSLERSFSSLGLSIMFSRNQKATLSPSLMMGLKSWQMTPMMQSQTRIVKRITRPGVAWIMQKINTKRVMMAVSRITRRMICFTVSGSEVLLDQLSLSPRSTSEVRSSAKSLSTFFFFSFFFSFSFSFFSITLGEGGTAICTCLISGEGTSSSSSFPLSLLNKKFFCSFTSRGSQISSSPYFWQMILNSLDTKAFLMGFKEVPRSMEMRIVCRYSSRRMQMPQKRKQRMMVPRLAKTWGMNRYFCQLSLVISPTRPDIEAILYSEGSSSLLVPLGSTFSFSFSLSLSFSLIKIGIILSIIINLSTPLQLNIIVVVMNIFDSLVSNTICQFSSNFSNSCLDSSSTAKSNKQYNGLELAKVLYKIEYIIYKKSRAAKYFAFGFLEEIKRANLSLPKILEKDERGKKMIEVLEWVYEKYYKSYLKEKGWESLIWNKGHPVFVFADVLRRVIEERQRKNKRIGIEGLKSIDNQYLRVDLFVDLVRRVMTVKRQELMSECFGQVQEYCKEREREELEKREVEGYEAALNQHRQEDEECLTVVNAFNNSPLSMLDTSKLSSCKHPFFTSSIDSFNQICDTEPQKSSVQATSNKTMKLSKENKKKIYLNHKTQSSRLQSQQNNHIYLRCLCPLEDMQPSFQPVVVDAWGDTLPSQFVNGRKSNTIRELHPDPIMKDLLGDLSDNLQVFPWSPLKDMTKSARTSSFSVAAFDPAFSKKKLSTGSILSKSQKYNPNLTHTRLIYQLKQPKKTMLTSSFKGDQTIKKMKSNLLADKKPKKTSTPHQVPQTTTKLLSFLRNESKQEMMTFNHYNNVSKTLSLKNSNEENRSRLRNSTNVWGLERREKNTEPDFDEVVCPHPRMIRKFSPITSIRERLLNHMK